MIAFPGDPGSMKVGCRQEEAERLSAIEVEREQDARLISSVQEGLTPVYYTDTAQTK